MTMWYKRFFDSHGEEGEFHANIRVPEDSPWFDGHFPHEPILPGIAQLGMAHDLLCRALEMRLPITQVSRVRFKQMIHPEQALVLTVKLGVGNSSHSFRIFGDEGLICSGLIRLASEPR